MSYLTTQPPPIDPRVVSEHLDGCSTCRLLMVEAARGLGSGRRVVRPGSEQATLVAGERVGERFEITRFLARGGMGEVYEARDIELQETVALKTLAITALDNEQALLRFKAEVKLARKVSHPNVCRIHQYGVHTRATPAGRAESIPFLTMELLEGETLAQRVRRRGALPMAESLPMLRQVLAALAAIHGAGVIHRDLKSDNVFVVSDPGGGERASVMDFGLARALDGSVLSSWPAAGQIAGTLDTMAPEQIEGKRPGPAADVFAFGVLVFELLAGRRPFVDMPPLDRLRLPPPQLAEAVPGVPAAWDELVRRCLAVDPDLRWVGVAELGQALERAAASGDAAARRPPWWRLFHRR